MEWDFFLFYCYLLGLLPLWNNGIRLIQERLMCRLMDPIHRIGAKMPQSPKNLGLSQTFFFSVFFS